MEIPRNFLFWKLKPKIAEFQIVSIHVDACAIIYNPFYPNIHIITGSVKL